MDSPKPEENSVPESNTPQTPTASNPAPEPVSTSSATPVMPEMPGGTPAPASSFTSAPAKSGSKLPLVLITVLLVVVGIAAVYFIMANGSKTSTTSKQATIDNGTITPPPSQPTTAVPTPTPDLSNSGLQQDSQTVDQNINDVNTQINQVNSALNDQQPSL